MLRPVIYPYKLGSAGARALANSLRQYRSKRVRGTTTRGRRGYKPFRNHLIINWGNQEIPSWYTNYTPHSIQPRNIVDVWLNHPDAVRCGSNKLTAFNAMRNNGVDTPDFTTNINEAAGWLSPSQAVVERNVLRGSRGVGIRIRHEGDALRASCPLFVKYFKKRYEWRVHVFKGEVISVQQKRRRTDNEADYSVRTHANGWVFCRNTITGYSPSVDSLAISAVESLGLDFGAVDIVYNSHYNRAVVLEVNTAPGLEGGSVDIYGQAIARLL